MFKYMIEEFDPISTLMISYLMQKDTDDNITTRNDRGGVGNARNLALSSLPLALRSNRESVFEMEVTATSLHINNMALSDVVESRDTMVEYIHNKVDMFKEERVVLKATLRQLQR